MYDNLIYFLLVLLFWTTAQSGEGPFIGREIDPILILVMYAGFHLLARQWFRRLAARFHITGIYRQDYSRPLAWLSILALLFYVTDVYLLGLKDIIQAIPLVERSSALTGLLGLAAFALFMIILWAEAYRVYILINQSQATRRAFVSNQLRFNLPIVLPYLIFSAAFDLLGLWPAGPIKEWLFSSVGEVVLMIAFLGGISIFFPLLLEPLWGLKPLEAGPQRRIIEEFSSRTGFTYRQVMLWPLSEGESPTAGVMGFFKRWRFLLVTKGLLRILDKEELEAVLGHELGHVRGRHLWLYLFFFAGFMVLIYIWSPLGAYVFLLSDTAMTALAAAQGRPTTALSFMVSAPIIVVMILYFRFVLGAFFRNFERAADLFSLRLTGSVAGLIGSLEKIAYRTGQGRNRPSWHHFSVAERVYFLERCWKDPSLINGHHRKLSLMVGVYLVAMVMVGWVGWQLQKGDLNQEASVRLLSHLLQEESGRTPNRPELFRLLGDLYYQRGRLDEAGRAYDRALALAPDDAETLNNLAWTLATKKGASLDEKARALALARRAASIKEASHILDTQAEALYLNGEAHAAVETAERALALAGPKDDKEYLRLQRKKFSYPGHP